MDKVKLLCSMNRQLMLEFSHRTTEGLERQHLFRMMMPVFRSFLELNVNKEVEKDSYIIRHAASLCQTTNKPTDEDVQLLLSKARQVDEKFLQQINPLPISITIHYQDIEAIRQQRIKLVLSECYKLLQQWQASSRFSQVVKSIYAETDLKEVLYNILHLYSMETRMLSRSVRVPSIMGMMRDSLSQSVYSVMDSVAKDMAVKTRDRICQQK